MKHTWSHTRPDKGLNSGFSFGLCDEHLVVGILGENPQRAGGATFLRVVPIAHERHERRDATGRASDLTLNTDFRNSVSPISSVNPSPQI